MKIELDSFIHEKTRLGIMLILFLKGKASFKELKKSLDTSEGSLSSHIYKLEEKGYVKVIKKFVNKRPFTSVEITEKGIKAIKNYMNSLKNLLKEVEGKEEG